MRTCSVFRWSECNIQWIVFNESIESTILSQLEVLHVIPLKFVIQRMWYYIMLCYSGAAGPQYDIAIRGFTVTILWNLWFNGCDITLGLLPYTDWVCILYRNWSFNVTSLHNLRHKGSDTTDVILSNPCCNGTIGSATYITIYGLRDFDWNTD